MRTINYSFIIPHKNSCNLLIRCLDSIPSRKDIQIIVIDDNSDVNNISNLKQIDCESKNIELIFTKENKGAGYARNVGLKHAKGKWLLFADSDDFYNANFLNDLDQYKNTNYDIIFFGVSSNITGKFDRSIEMNNNLQLYLKGERSKKELKYLFWQPWNKIFSRQFIVKNNIQFDEIPIGNDAFFSFRASKNTNNIYAIASKIYCVTYNENSITYRKSNFEREICLLDINIKINKFLREEGLGKYQLRFLRKIPYIAHMYGINKCLTYLKYIKEHDSFRHCILSYLYKLLLTK